jgi:hypothetical protein
VFCGGGGGGGGARRNKIRKRRRSAANKAANTSGTVEIIFLNARGVGNQVQEAKTFAAS